MCPMFSAVVSSVLGTVLSYVLGICICLFALLLSSVFGTVRSFLLSSILCVRPFYLRYFDIISFVVENLHSSRLSLILRFRLFCLGYSTFVASIIGILFRHFRLEYSTFVSSVFGTELSCPPSWIHSFISSLPSWVFDIRILLLDSLFSSLPF